MIAAFVRLVCRIYGLFLGEAARRSRPIEGSAERMGPRDMLWWAYKYFIRPVELPEPGKGIEERFAAQDLSFRYGDGFVEEAGLWLTVGGDLLGSPDIRPDNTPRLWDEVRDFYLDANIVYANLETPILPTAPTGYVPANVLSSPVLNGSPELFDRIVDGGRGINLFSTANNHCLDQGEAGLAATLDFLDSRGYPHVGTARSPEERDRVLALEHNGVKVAFLAYTYSLNGKKIPAGKDYLVNYLPLNRPGCDLSLVERQAAAAREAGADLVVACLHWSLEFESYPIEAVMANGRRIIEAGVDIIVGNHAHGVQPIEAVEVPDPSSGGSRRALVIYALGDLLSHQSYAVNSAVGNLARIRLSKGRAAGRPCARITSLSVLPTYHGATMAGGRCEDYRLRDLRAAAAGIASGAGGARVGGATAADILRLSALAERVLGPALAGPGSGGGR